MKDKILNHDMTVNFILYPGSKDKLEYRIKEVLNTNLKSGTKTPSSVKSILSPHGGWNLCANIMGAAYAAVAGAHIQRVVLLSRVHREPLKAVFLPEFLSFSTPLGQLDVDNFFLSRLSETSNIFKYNNIPHVEEHSIEVQLPFIKYLWPKAKIVPILTGKASFSLIKKLSDSLITATNNEMETTLFVVSSSMSGYNKKTITEAQTELFLAKLSNPKDWESLPKLLNEDKIGACSADCLAVVLKMFGEKASVNLLDINYGRSLNENEKRVCFGALTIE
jgi:MEMO1 family protein